MARTPDVGRQIVTVWSRGCGEDPSPVSQTVLEEAGQLVERDEVDAIVEIDVTGAGNDDQFLGLSSEGVGVLAELAGVRVLPGDEQHRSRRDCLDVVEGIEVHELDVAGHRGLRAGVGAVAARGAVEVVELPVYRGGLVGEFLGGAAGVRGLPAAEFGVALFGSSLKDLTALFKGDGVAESVAVGCAHVVHADGGHRLDARVDLRSTDDETATGTDSKRANAFAVHERLRA